MFNMQQPSNVPPIPSPEHEGDYPRGIQFQAIANMRDFGGLPIENSTRVVKRGMITRSAAPTYATPDDTELLLGERDVLTLIDFRTSYETKNLNFGKKKFEDNFCSFYVRKSNDAEIDQIDESKEALVMEGEECLTTFRRLYKGTPRKGERRNSLSLGVPRKRYSIPLINDRFFSEGVYETAPPAIKLKTQAVRCVLNDKVAAYFLLRHLNDLGLFEMYRLTVEYCKKEVLTILSVFKNYDNYPISFFCSLGKDRTGIMTALILSCLGVPRDMIIDDFHLSEIHLAHNMPEIKKYFQKIGLTKEEFVLAPKETMKQLLEYLDTKYGSVGGYLDDIGFSYEDQANFRDMMTEEKTVQVSSRRRLSISSSNVLKSSSEDTHPQMPQQQPLQSRGRRLSLSGIRSSINGHLRSSSDSLRSSTNSMSGSTGDLHAACGLEELRVSGDLDSSTDNLYSSTDSVGRPSIVVNHTASTPFNHQYSNSPSIHKPVYSNSPNIHKPVYSGSPNIHKPLYSNSPNIHHQYSSSPNNVFKSNHGLLNNIRNSPNLTIHSNNSPSTPTGTPPNHSLIPPPANNVSQNSLINSPFNTSSNQQSACTHSSPLVLKIHTSNVKLATISEDKSANPIVLTPAATPQCP